MPTIFYDLISKKASILILFNGKSKLGFSRKVQVNMHSNFECFIVLQCQNFSNRITHENDAKCNRENELSCYLLVKLNRFV